MELPSQWIGYHALPFGIFVETDVAYLILEGRQIETTLYFRDIGVN